MRIKVKPLPRHGQREYRVRFAWWPRRCSDDTIRWMERVVAEEHGRMVDTKLRWVVEAYHPKEKLAELTAAMLQSKTRNNPPPPGKYTITWTGPAQFLATGDKLQFEIP